MGACLYYVVMQVCMYACMHECMYISVCVCIYACMYACIKIKKIKSKIFYSHKTVILMNINNISKTVICKNRARGHPFMTSTKNQVLTFLPPLLICVHMVIYITNLYRGKISTFFCPKTKFW